MILTPRHDTTTSHALTFASWNVRSLTSTKLDTLLVDIQQRSVDVLLLCEKWHDADLASIRRLRANGCNVVDRARPRDCRQASLSVNHGVVVIVTVTGVSLTAVDVGVQPSTFECVAARVTSGTSSGVVVLLYRSGSAAVTAIFLAELSDVLNQFSTYVDPLVLAGDVNIRLERTADPYTIQFVELLACHGLVRHVQGVTHVDGGTIDVVCARGDLPAPTVNVLDVGPSDHCQLRWLSPFVRPAPVYTTANRRLWRSSDSDSFLASQQASAVCDVQQYEHLDGDALVQLCDTTFTELLDQFGALVVDKGRRACGLMTNVVEQIRR